MLRRLWPASLQGQVLLALALALLLAQGISTALMFRAVTARRHENLTHTLAFRLFNTAQPRAGTAQGEELAPAVLAPPGAIPDLLAHPARPQLVARFAPMASDVAWPDAEARLRQVLSEQDLPVARVVVVDRSLAEDPAGEAQADRRAAILGRHHPSRPERVLIGAVQRTVGGPWLVARALIPPDEGAATVLRSLLLQTVTIYLILVGAMAMMLRRITRPLAKLTTRLGQFAGNPGRVVAMAPEGPEDLRRLIVAHNAMEARIGALLDEKDVMLGAIGHDLKTPLAALRVRIEVVEDDVERGKMAATIEDITRSLDDLLSLARVGRPSDPLEPTELSALVAAVVEEYEDMGDPVTMGDLPRTVLPLRTTWVRRALRNLISNALRYAGTARVASTRERVGGRDWAVIRIDDDGPGIPDGDMGRMLEPFTRGDPSRNSQTGGAGLGLTLARAVAEQHGGTLLLANRLGGDGKVAGLSATLRLPLSLAETR